MKRYEKVLAVIPVLALSLTLSACGEENTKYTIKDTSNTIQSTQDFKLTYEDLMESPSSFQGNKVKFKGIVSEVITKENATIIKMAVQGDYNNMIVASFNSDTISSKVNPKDLIKISGTFTGMMKYKDISGREIDMPGIWVDSIS